MLAAARGERHRGDHNSLEEILDPGIGRPLAKPLFDALRNGLAHGYDTKHILFREKPYQIHMSWNARVPLEVTRSAAPVCRLDRGC